MTAIHRKKNSRQRATTTHGWGSMKKHRGAGNRGGRGNAGSGKRGDAKKPSFDTTKYGKHGFIKKNAVIISKTISLGQIASNFSKFVSDNKEGSTSAVDLKSLGFDKLLSSGEIKSKLTITVSFASKKAVAKVRAAGGEVIGLIPKKSKDSKKEEGQVVSPKANAKAKAKEEATEE